MSVARRRWSPDEKATVLRLSKEGYTQRDIADKLRPGIKTAWRSVGEIIREANREKVEATTDHLAPGVSSTPVIPSSSAYSSRVELPEGMVNSLTAREFMRMMNDDQREIFVATYEDLRGDADQDSLTSAENDMLIRAAYNNVKYLKAQHMLYLAEGYMQEELEGGLTTGTDEDKAKKRLAGNREIYKKEVEQWGKEYSDLLTDLKLTRKQRLDKIKDTRNTFLDLQEELSAMLKKGSLIEDVKKLNLVTEEELRRMARGELGPDGRRYTWLVGAFDEFMPEGSAPLRETEKPQPPQPLENQESSDGPSKE